MAQRDQVRFIRKGGKIIPIRKKKERRPENFGFEGSTEQITVRKRVGDKIITKQAPRFVRNLGKPDFDNPRARKLIQREIESIAGEVKHANKQESGLVIVDKKDSRGFRGDRVVTRTVNPSTFPKEFALTKAKSKADFEKIAKRGKGIRFNRLRKLAIDRLSHGFKSATDFDEPNKEFLLASKQIFDNKNTIFRRVKGRVIPIKVDSRNRYDLLEEAPF